ncbi:ATP-binding protein [Salarchaeum sp. III]|uniref:ATP-binding protein n=1 Tax=Salarchaeum sp. III TaxID=3107927 RepID=UPI002ED9E777
MTTSDDDNPETIYETAKEYGATGDSVNIDINFRIIKQFSEQLYDNPRRAIEELVCNSYDAGATECHINTPGEVGDSLYVLDNGNSMDMEGLQWLWNVASSRKTEEGRTEGSRQQIGKFGVGKLASFALGSRLTYAATTGETTRVVSVHQNRLKGSDRAQKDFDVYEFPKGEAEEYLGNFFQEVPNPWEREWDSWTLAVVEEVPERNVGNNLQPWHLKNMIQTAIPTSTDFTAYLNQEKIKERDPHGEEVFSVDVTSDEMVERIETVLKTYWSTHHDISPEEVEEELYEVELTTFKDPENTDERLAGLEVPVLGKVSGEARYFDRPLTTTKRRERGFQDNGFRIHVRGKLINKSDPLFGLDPLSHSVWANFLGEFEMPGLDEEIRVQRDQLKDEPATHIARRIARQSFQEVRSQKRRADAEDDDEGEEGESSENSPSTGPAVQRSFSERLQERSRPYAYDAVSGLHTQGSNLDINLSEVEVKLRPLRSTDRAVEFDSDDSVIIINEGHPLIDTLRSTSDFTQNIEDAFKEILAARLLIHGYLRNSGADGMALAASRQIFDSVLRSAAGTLGADELRYQLEELDDASTVGGTRFENAVVDIFQNVGLAAAQEGGPDTHDGIIEIPQVGENYRVSMEAKGSQGVVSHAQLSFDSVNRHRTEQNCDQAVVIARTFQTEGRENNRSALLRNLDSDINEGAVENISLMTTRAMETFLKLHDRQPFTYSETIEILGNEEHPDNLPDRIVEVWEAKPTDELTEQIIEIGHEMMETDPTNPPSVGGLAYDERLRGTEKEEIEKRLESLDVLTASVTKEENTFEIDAPPKTVLQEVNSTSASVDDALNGDLIVSEEETEE